MPDALTIALSGLTAQKQVIDATANNIANVSTTGRVPTKDNPVSTVYKPLSVSLTALTSGGVQGQVTEDPNGYTPSYSPADIYANSEGFIAAPNVDLTREIVNLIESKVIFRANLSVIKTEDRLQKDFLDTIA